MVVPMPRTRTYYVLEFIAASVIVFLLLVILLVMYPSESEEKDPVLKVYDKVLSLWIDQLKHVSHEELLAIKMGLTYATGEEHFKIAEKMRGKVLPENEYRLCASFIFFMVKPSKKLIIPSNHAFWLKAIRLAKEFYIDAHSRRIREGKVSGEVAIPLMYYKTGDRFKMIYVWSSSSLASYPGYVKFMYHDLKYNYILWILTYLDFKTIKGEIKAPQPPVNLTIDRKYNFIINIYYSVSNRSLCEGVKPFLSNVLWSVYEVYNRLPPDLRVHVNESLKVVLHLSNNTKIPIHTKINNSPRGSFREFISTVYDLINEYGDSLIRVDVTLYENPGSSMYHLYLLHARPDFLPVLYYDFMNYVLSKIADEYPNVTIEHLWRCTPWNIRLPEDYKTIDEGAVIWGAYLYDPYKNKVIIPRS